MKAMKILVSGTPEEIKELFNTNGDSKEQFVTEQELNEVLKHYVKWKD